MNSNVDAEKKGNTQKRAKNSIHKSAIDQFWSLVDPALSVCLCLIAALFSNIFIFFNTAYLNTPRMQMGLRLHTAAPAAQHSQLPWLSTAAQHPSLCDRSKIHAPLESLRSEQQRRR